LFVTVPPFAGPADENLARPEPALSQPATTRGGDGPSAAQERGGPLTMEEAVLHTLVYADLFDYPLTVPEIHRYLTGRRASRSEIEEYLGQNGPPGGRFGLVFPYWCLAGREQLAGLRREREAFSQALWREARRYGRLMAAVPFVRMAAVTGSLAMNNASSEQDDIDFLIVTARHRLWLARGLVILVVHLARRQGLELCPNFIMAEHHLQVGETSLFVAHELAQIVPLYGQETYQRLLSSNAWIAEYLPNATPRSAGAGQIGGVARRGQQLLEAALAGGAGDAVERWESGRKISRLCWEAQQRGAAGATFTPDMCKGHLDDHAFDVRRRYAEGLAAQGIGPSRAWVRL
jgi:hypothetical protein